MCCASNRPIGRVVRLRLIGNKCGRPIFIRDTGKAAHRLFEALAASLAAGQRILLVDIGIFFFLQPLLADNAEGVLDDVNDVVVGSTNASLFAYLANGTRGLAVLQLTAPDTQPRFYGFSPEPKPQLIATRETSSAALALSKGLDRDRAVDETGGQIAVFGRVGSRPFTADEMAHLYRNPDGSVWTVDKAGKADDFVPRGEGAR